jgi:23S rRNA pseudouridine2605 synthase
MKEGGLVPAMHTSIHVGQQKERGWPGQALPQRTMAGANDNTTSPGERVAKTIARAGLASRREAEAWIASGRVAINGTVIASPAVNVGAKDRVTVDGAPLPRRERTRLFLFHKPRGLVTTHADTHGRPTIFGALPKHLPRLVSVGRLDLTTEGLLLLTNDGGLARALELPETGWLRRYRVRAHGRVTQDQLDRLRAGVTVDGIRYGPIEAAIDRDQGTNVWLTFAIREGKNREVRNVLEHLGLKVARLIRVSFGPFQLGELPPGAIEEVKTRHLREQLGERLAAKAGCDFSGPISVHDEAVRQPEKLNHNKAGRSPLPPRTPDLIRGERRGGAGAESTGGGGRLPATKEPPTRPASPATLPAARKSSRGEGKSAAQPRVTSDSERREGQKPRRAKRRYHGKRER